MRLRIIHVHVNLLPRQSLLQATSTNRSEKACEGTLEAGRIQYPPKQHQSLPSLVRSQLFPRFLLHARIHKHDVRVTKELDSVVHHVSLIQV